MREGPESRLLKPVEQLRTFYYLMLPREPDIGDQVVVEPGQPLARTRMRIPFCDHHAGAPPQPDKARNPPEVVRPFAPDHSDSRHFSLLDLPAAQPRF